VDYAIGRVEGIGGCGGVGCQLKNPTPKKIMKNIVSKYGNIY